MPQLLVQVLAVQHPAALVVDDGALAVEDLVVLEDVLADLEVLRLDLGLRGADGVADHLRLDRHVLRDVEAGEEVLDHRGVEQPHQVVAEREVEPRLAGVALAAGPAAQLVVDAPRLVALGAEHVEAAELGHLVVLGRDLVLDRLDRLGPRLLVVLRRLDRVEAAGAQLVVGAELDVAAEHDVGAAAGHVGRDGDGTPAAGLGDDGRLAFVVLRVEHLVLDPALLQQRATGARTSRR